MGNKPGSKPKYKYESFTFRLIHYLSVPARIPLRITVDLWYLPIIIMLLTGYVLFMTYLFIINLAFRFSETLAHVHGYFDKFFGVCLLTVSIYCLFITVFDLWDKDGIRKMISIRY